MVMTERAGYCLRCLVCRGYITGDRAQLPRASGLLSVEWRGCGRCCMLVRRVTGPSILTRSGTAT